MEITVTKFPLVLLVFCIATREFLLNTDAHSTKCLDSEREALADFKNGLDDPANRLSSWKGSDCCQWQGISCDNSTGAIIAVDLHNPYPDGFYSSSGRYVNWDLQGEIAPSLKKLKSLRHLDLSFNTFNDNPVPDFLGSLRSLQHLDLSYTGFSGAIPPSLGNLSSLQYLDVSNEDYMGSQLFAQNLEWVAGLVSLKHLGMNVVDLSVVGSYWFRSINRLPSLTELHLSSCSLSGSIPSPTSVNLTSLVVLDLSDNHVSSKIPDWLVNISSFTTLDLSSNELFGRIPLSFSDLPNLQHLDLSINKLTASCHQLLWGKWEKIQVLHLGSNHLHGELPASIGNLKFLVHLDIAYNNVEGGIPSSIGNLCNLESLDISSNKMNGTLPEILEGTKNCLSKRPLPSLRMLGLSDNQLVGKLPEWLAQLENLVYLDLSKNSLYGPIPASFGILQQNLTILKLEENELNGTLPESLGQLSKLSSFDVSSNHLTGFLTETHFSKQAKLSYLSLSSNSFTLNVSSSWVPPFQVTTLFLGSCYLGPSFPEWVKPLNYVTHLDFSNASISGPIPYWFWESFHSLSHLNLSFNQLAGQIPSPLKSYTVFDFSSNNFSGSMPSFNGTIWILDLSKNKLSGNIPNNMSQSLVSFSVAYNQINGEIPTSIGNNVLNLRVFDISNNNFKGSIPSSIGNCSYLSVLDISNNHLSGTIPNSFSRLNWLQSLHLNDNELYGQLPSSFRNLSRLQTLNLGNNRLTGRIPPWIGEGFGSLRILSLRSNSFSEELPTLLSNISSLQVLDLAENQLTGRIPTSFGHFRAMLQAQIINYHLFYGSPFVPLAGENIDIGSYFERFDVIMKGQLLRYTKTLSLVIVLDLSGNNLSGDLPMEITNLLGLVVLNLSRNCFTGHIPENISKLKQLSSLDLSSNRFSGSIPQSLGTLSFLGYLNLSNNDLSGAIPYKDHITTFDASSFAGNNGLCGGPLSVRCPGDENDGKSDKRWMTPRDTDNDDSFTENWFYSSIGLGFAAGVLVPYLVMALRKSWSVAYFDVVDKVVDRILYLWLKYTTIMQRTRVHQQRR